ncbi:MAG: SLBB domain-containing protein [Deltaproteobacteria bacterium]|nr:SLBB domain-containing protein [Deltaproteobacteria bacterium]
MNGVLFPAGHPAGDESLEAYRARGGYEAWHAALRSLSPEPLIEQVTAAGLRGRGGAGFPTGRKWALARQAEGTPRYVVCNGGEDEPGSMKDRLLLEHHPHLVLEGTLLAAYAIGASTAYLYINRLYERALARAQAAIAEALAEGEVGEHVQGSPFSIEVQTFPAPTTYVAGEDTAALEAIEGKEALPRPKPPYPVTVGLHGKPTLVNNVETLANVPAIVRQGPAWFRGLGTGDTPGTMIFCLGEEVARPGAYELPLGTPLRHLVEVCGGGLRGGRRLKAILPGGPSSAFLLPEALDVRLDHQALREAGSSLGCGVVRLFPEGTCLLEETLAIAEFFARESCGQCPACRMETGMYVALLQKLQKGQGGAALLEQIPKIGAYGKGKGYCSLISMPVPPVESAVKLFPDDFTYHLEHGRCPE